MSKIKPEQLDQWFDEVPITPQMTAHARAIAEAAKSLAKTILAHTPQSADQHAAIRKVREAYSTACEAVFNDIH